MSRKSISERAKSGDSAGGSVVFFSIFLLAGLGFSMIFAVPAWKVAKSYSWTATKAEILDSLVATHAGDDGSTYSIEVRYRYAVDGRSYESDRYDFLDFSSSGYEGKKEVVEALPKGSFVTCHVDPDEPWEAVLYRGFSWPYLFALLPLIFVAIGGGGLIAILFRRFAAPKFGSGKHTAVPGGGLSGIDPWSSPPPSLTLPVHAGLFELEESFGPAGKLGCMVVIGLFWNGIVAIFVWRLWLGWRAGAGVDFWQAVFLTPFVLVGLVMLLGVAYQTLALANPRPRLTLSRADVPLGGSVRLEWSFRGAAQRLQDLRIWLEGEERATYRRGTSSHTDSEVFATRELVNLTGERSLASGSTTIEIPADTMHSFEAPHNEIVWTLKLKGSIDRWPDVVTEFPFKVEPGSGAR